MDKDMRHSGSHSRISLGIIRLGWVVGALVVLLVACGTSDPGAQPETIEPVGPVAEPPAEAEDLLARLEDARDDQERLQAELAALSAEELVDLLDVDAEDGREPFNSLAFREIQRRGETIGQELADVIQRRDRPSYLAIIALREVDGAAYQEMNRALIAEILVEALGRSEYFNTWGIPHLYWEDGALAIIEQAEASAQPLRALLDDDRPAPVFGSEEVVESELYGYRVKDYALALLAEIEGQRLELPIDPTERDSMISSLDGGN